ncbi:hypothetical protein G9C98_006012 [Cotesia typhae]|uniref:Tubulin/FtsZ GTPase domain-containing protein n=1 Tax=Cotesia typhae TaxID=2053667 RepID=A0A8J5UYN1_9HYME|nr:hypothetical protein G9C98_006012 [Cotesia typhae]
MNINLTELNSVSRLFNPENVINGESGASNNWAAGCYTEGSLLINRALEAIRQEAESCDLIQGNRLKIA